MSGKGGAGDLEDVHAHLAAELVLGGDRSVRGFDEVCGVAGLA
jgi:hypothetical protein